MNRQLLLGLLAALGAAVTGSGWQLATRHGVSTTLGPLELALLRYGVPALLLGPLWIRRTRGLPAVNRRTLALLVIGGGLPFGMLVLAGAQWAPAAHMGVFMAGSMPLFTALGAWVIRGDRVRGARLFGLICIAVGMIFFAVSSWRVDTSSWRGDVLFLMAAVLWATYSLAFGQSGLTPWQGAAFVNGCSALILIPIVVMLGAPKLLTAPWTDIALQALGQGVLAGLVGLAVYGAAIQRLGAPRASLSAAIVPVLTTLGAAWLLAEPMTTATLAALALVVPGVAMASGALQWRAARLTSAHHPGSQDSPR